MELLVDGHAAGVVRPPKQHGGGAVVGGEGQGAVGGDVDVNVRCGRAGGGTERECQSP